uniref:KIB1-4 beta-propeller domain-containing protein n=1 Tax=Solanum tuberosum TaxID=4113 RepID=M1D9G8_SOLTU
MRLEEKKKENSEYDGPPLSSVQPYPWFVICPPRKTQTFFNISEDRSYKRSIHELCNAIIRASAQEWLVLEDFDSTDCYLWNPISNDKIQLPPPPYNDNLECLLSAPPNDPQCRVLFLMSIYFL